MTIHLPTARRCSSRAAAVLAALLLLPATGAQAASAEPERVVVTFAPGTTAGERAEVIEDAGGDTAVALIPAVAPDMPSAVVLPDVTAEQRSALQQDPDVVAVEDDVVVRADAVAPDPAYPLQNGLREIGVDAVWDRTTGDDDVVIAVIDTGVDTANPDVAGKLVAGYDFVNGDADPDDDNGHGTAVATVAAAASNAVGIAGVCPRCRVMPIKALDTDGTGYLSDAARAIVWAVEHGADIINLSLGGTSQLRALTSALQGAEDAGVLVVASAGNASTDTPNWPAADPLAVAVAATDRGVRARYSNFGSWVDVAAPGCNPASDLASGVRTFCGTSSSAPLVAGVAGLAESMDGEIDSADLRALLTATAHPAGAGLGAGIVDADGLVTRLLELRPAAPAPAPVETPLAPTFRDIAGSVHAGNIVTLATVGITSGCTADAYCPARGITRGQIATFLQRGLDLPASTGSFADVPADHPHAAGIAAAAAAGITNGCAPSRFCPGAGLTRGQMASLLSRALRLPAGTGTAFADVPADHPHAAGIAAVAAAGITNGCAPTTASVRRSGSTTRFVGPGPTNFCPDRTVNRGQMASFLVRALDL